jgi:predicted transcriptional regulator
MKKIIISTKLVETPYNAILGLAQKFILSRVLMIFAELQLGKLLEDKPLPLLEISSALNVNPDALRRFLRLLTAHHVINDEGNDVYSATSISQYFDQILKRSLVKDYEGLDKALEALKNNNNHIWPTIVGESFQKYLNKYLLQSIEPAINELMILAHEFIASKVIMSAAELKFDMLFKNGPLSLNEISSQLNVEANILQPFLKILVQHQILEESPTQIYNSTPLTECLDRVLSPHILDGYRVFIH